MNKLKSEISKRLDKQDLKELVLMLRSRALSGDTQVAMFLLSNLGDNEQEKGKEEKKEKKEESKEEKKEKKEKKHDEEGEKSNGRHFHVSVPMTGKERIFDTERHTLCRTLMSIGPKTKEQIQKITTLPNDHLEKLLDHPDFVFEKDTLKYTISQAVFERLKE